MSGQSSSDTRNDSFGITSKTDLLQGQPALSETDSLRRRSVASEDGYDRRSSVSDTDSFIEAGIANAITVRRIRPLDVKRPKITDAWTRPFDNLFSGDPFNSEQLPPLPESVYGSDKSLPPLPESPVKSSSRLSFVGSERESAHAEAEQEDASPFADPVSPAYTTVRHILPSRSGSDSSSHYPSGVRSPVSLIVQPSLSVTASPDPPLRAYRSSYALSHLPKPRNLQEELQVRKRATTGVTLPDASDVSISRSVSLGDRMKSKWKNVHQRSAALLHSMRGPKSSRIATNSTEEKKTPASSSQRRGTNPFRDPAFRKPDGDHDGNGRSGGYNCNVFRVSVPEPPEHIMRAFYQKQVRHDHEILEKLFRGGSESPDILPPFDQSPPPIPPRHPLHTYRSDKYTPSPSYSASSTASVYSSAASVSTSTSGYTPSSFPLPLGPSPLPRYVSNSLLDALPLNDDVQIAIALDKCLKRKSAWFCPVLGGERGSSPDR